MKTITKKLNGAVTVHQPNRVAGQPDEVITTTPESHANPIGKDSDTLRTIMLKSAGLQTKVDANLAEISNQLLVVAQTYQDKEFVHPVNGQRIDEASERFVNVCAIEEAFIKSDSAGDLKREKLPRCWTQAKSNIKAALEFGINLKDYTSESALRKAVINARGMKDADPVKAALSTFTKALDGLSPEAALAILHDAEAAVHAALMALVPNEPVKKNEQQAA